MQNLVRNQKAALARGAAEAADWAERFQAELEVGRFLCERHPRQAAGWGKLLTEAAAQVEAAVGTGSAATIRSAVKKAEGQLAPLGRAAKEYTVYCAGHAHIDMNWMWSWPETVGVTIDTFRTVLALMAEFPEFHFSQSQASVYQILEQYAPDLLRQVAQRVKEGRWEVTASHWVENDGNLAGPEALCRHLLHTRAYMRELFGLTPEDVPINWAPDTFGHALTDPSYLVRGGVKYMYLHRPGAEGPKRPVAFWWQAPDRSRVLVRNDMAFGYNGVIAPENLLKSLRLTVTETGLPLTLFVYGVGDHGGGPTRRDLLRGRDMATWPVFPRLAFAPAKAFFADLERRGAGLPVLTNELNFELAGCYTTQSLIKKGNRFGETRLTDAEIATALAWAAIARPFPAAAFRDGWRDILFNHFHDILPGSGVHDTRTYAHGLFQRTMAMTGSQEIQALRQLAAAVDTSGLAGPALPAVPASRVAAGQGAGVGFGTVNGGPSAAEQGPGQGNRPFLIFNPTNWERTEVVEATIWDNAVPGQQTPFAERRFAVHTADGQRLPAQTVTSGGYWGHQYVTVAFPVTVPGLGYITCAVVEADDADSAAAGVRQVGRSHHCFYVKHEREPEGLENDLLRVELDPVTGGIRSLVDKRSGAAVISVAGAAPVLEYGVEVPHGMTAWIIDHNGPLEYPRVTGITRKGAGPHKAALEVKLSIRESDFTLTYEVRAGDPRLYLHLTGTWFQRGTPQTGVPFLRFAFPLNLEKACGRYEIPFGAIDRSLNAGQEVPAQQWAQVTGLCNGKEAGVLLANDSKYGHSLDGSALRLSLIRAAYDPDPLPEIGQHEVHVALQPFGGELPVAAAMQVGRAFNHALRVVGTDVHPGELPPTASLATVAPASVVLNCLKKAEADDSLVLILSEPSGKDTTAQVTFNRDILGEVTSAVEVDLLERPVAKSTAKARGNAVRVNLSAHGIASVLVTLTR